MPRFFDSETLYNNIYKNQSSIPGYDRYWKYSEDIQEESNPLNYITGTEAIYWGVYQALKKNVKDKLTTKIIEVGSGLGYLTYALKMDGYDISGVDISKVAVEEAIAKFGNYYSYGDIFTYKEEKFEYFDIVILTEIIEHINDPIPFLQALVDIIKPGGKIILTTPNRSFYPSDIIWATENPPIHCWWLSEESIQFMAKQLDLKVNFLDFSKYYKKNYTSCDIRILRKRQIPLPVFDEYGNLIPIIHEEQSISLISRIKALLSKSLFLKNIYYKMLDLNNPDIIRCGVRGTVMCAILEKKPESK
jgi:SAM-dependent methyltransferase